MSAPGRAPDEKVRLFVALELPSRVIDSLTAWRDPIVAGEGALRAVPPGSLHVTLCFLGWRDAADAEPIAAVCRSVAALPSARLALGEALWLPPRRPRVLAIELRDDGSQLAAVQAALSERLDDGGWYVPEKRPFRPHVTVARVRANARVRVRELPAPAREPEWFAGSLVTLFRSRLSPSGARYEPLESVELP